MNGALLGTLVVALSGLAGVLGASWISNRSTTRAQTAANELEERKVNREDFDAITRELRTSLADLDRKLNAAESAREAAEERANLADRRALRAEERAAAAELAARRLEKRVTQLESVLRENGMPIPPHPTHP